MDNREKLKTIVSRENLSTSPRCPACGRSFSMGEPGVLAYGSWGDELRLVHEDDAVYDEAKECYTLKEGLPS